MYCSFITLRHINAEVM